MSARIHCLKTWPEPYRAVVSGEKRYEIREADRPFKERDVLVLQEWVPAHEGGCVFVQKEFGVAWCEMCHREPGDEPRGQYTGEMVAVRVTYMTPPGKWKLPENLCVMSIERVALGAAERAALAARTPESA